ncbi:hypothetical protein ABIC89_000812 [Variovorax boronicumulans]|uniref:hypothetical protein n=1 Tax=Variovorax boronicumulans TaxID=436515 RepID=UPI0033958494
MKNAFTLARKYGSKALVLAAAGTASVGAFAQEAGNPILELLGGVSLAGVAAAVLALCVIIVAIAMTMKGPVIAKRVINRV